ncbi:hypothetical protein [Anaerococcus tetradius]|uniref:N-acetyltransferase domain-containing protein n=1 Tax=Anaerococcus tetradius TaxID=33036 RepID=A0A133KFW8_9FIRM|nr:hypothetical protein [Anaerococcus tetradius]KWZ78420.1 hypothetical protein HMPREF3200_00783 [Anaerococcus tetradius]
MDKDMDVNFKKQIMNDYSITYEEFEAKGNIFKVNKADDSFMFNDKKLFSAICTGGRIFMRSENSDLIDKLRQSFKAYPGAWFAEADNIRSLYRILGEFGIEIDNFFPLMSFTDRNVLVRDFAFTRIEKEDIEKFKGKTKMAFSFDEDDRLGLSYYDGKKLIALAGSSISGKYLWDIGLEKFSDESKYVGLATSILRSLSLIIRQENPNVSPITTTQFSHTRSINTAIRAGYEMNLCLTGREK